MSDRRRQIGLVVLIAGHALLVFLLPVMTDWAEGKSETALALLIGLGIGQVALLSGWTAIGPGRFVDRAPAMVFLIALFWYLLLLGNRLLVWPMSTSDSVFLGMLVFGEYAFLQISFWLVRVPLGWRIERDERGRSREPMGKTQFGMRRLLAWTAGAAALLAAGRWLLPPTDERLLSSQAPPLEFYASFCVISIPNVMFALPAVWIVFRAGRAWPGWVFMLGVCCIMVSELEFEFLNAIPGGGPPRVTFTSAMLLNVGLFACMAGTLAAIRMLGYRMPPAARPRRAPPREAAERTDP